MIRNAAQRVGGTPRVQPMEMVVELCQEVIIILNSGLFSIL